MPNTTFLCTEKYRVSQKHLKKKDIFIVVLVFLNQLLVLSITHIRLATRLVLENNALRDKYLDLCHL